jgi:uncharacterized membrane protein YhaH (DUF805 family)
MLGYLFGFNARIGRLHYFLASIGLAIVITGIIFAIASAAYHGNAKAIPMTVKQMQWPLIAVAVTFCLATLTLQSMRFRDIGWDPVCVIPGWIALMIVDYLIATKIPAVSLGPEHNGTIVGALTNLGLFLALTFWPGGSHETAAPTFGAPPSNAPPRRQDTASLAASRVARVAGGEFGRRA